MNTSGVEIQTTRFPQFARVIVLGTDSPYREYYFLHEVSIGRGPENSVRIRHGSVSERHATIQEQRGRFVLTDLGSTNGTFVDGQRIQERDLGRFERLKIGTCEVVFLSFRPEGRWEEGQPALLPPADGAVLADHTSFSQSMVIQTPQQQRGPATLIRGDPMLGLMTRVLALIEFAPREGTVPEICRDVLERLLEILPGERAVILLLEGGMPIVRAVHCSTGSPDEPVQVPRDVVQRVLGERKGILCATGPEDSRPGSRSTGGHWIRSLVAAPIIGADVLMGVIYVDSATDSNAVDKETLQVLMLVGRAVGVLVRENQQIQRQADQSERRAMARRFLPAGRKLATVPGPGGATADPIPRTPTACTAAVLRLTVAPASTEPVEAAGLLMLLDAYLTRAQEIVVQHGGSVEWVAGTMLKAVFGYPDGDAGLPAIEAALDLQREGFALSLKARLAMGLELLSRTSVEEGALVVGAAGSGAQLHMLSVGPASDGAGRLMGFAQPGEVLVGPGLVELRGSELRLGREVMVPGAAGPARSLLGKPGELAPARVVPQKAQDALPAQVRAFRLGFDETGIVMPLADDAESFIIQLPQTPGTVSLVAGELVHITLALSGRAGETSFLVNVEASDVLDPSEDQMVTLRTKLIAPRILEMD